jgi:hypothetical protein
MPDRLHVAGIASLKALKTDTDTDTSVHISQCVKPSPENLSLPDPYHLELSLMEYKAGIA